jgi:hypothetical protein
MLSKHWNITAEVGPGIYYMRDEQRFYKTGDRQPECIRHYRRIVVAPSKLELSFYYLF